jgi:hypothetical protein
VAAIAATAYETAEAAGRSKLLFLCGLAQQKVQLVHFARPERSAEGTKSKG